MACLNLVVRYRFLVVLVIISYSLLGRQALAHPDHKTDDIQFALYKWVNATRIGNALEIGALLSEEFVGPGKSNRKSFLESVEKYSSRYDFNIEQAVLDRKGENVQVSNIVLAGGTKGMIPSVYTLLFRKVGSSWKIATMSQTHRSIPFELSTHKKLPEQALTFPAVFSLRDESTGAAAFARIRITDADGEYWPPRGHPQVLHLLLRSKANRSAFWIFH